MDYGAPWFGFQRRLQEDQQKFQKLLLDEQLTFQAKLLGQQLDFEKGLSAQGEEEMTKVTSIAARYLANATTVSFAIYKVAEERGIAYADVAQHYAELEKIMLQEFCAFVDRHRTWRWVHWNMRDINYGFPSTHTPRTLFENQIMPFFFINIRACAPIIGYGQRSDFGLECRPANLQEFDDDRHRKFRGAFAWGNDLPAVSHTRYVKRTDRFIVTLQA